MTSAHPSPHGGYDAVLLLSFGGPEGPDDVMPFLRRVTAGRGVPDERLEEVAHHYHHFGGVSPINDQNRALQAALRAEFDAHGIDLPLYWGNRNWDPLVADTVRTMRDDGVRRAVVFATSATGSYSGCRQYRDDLAGARAEVAADSAGDAPELVKLRHFYDHPRYVTAHADGLRAALATLPADQRDSAQLVFTAHSIPTSMDDQAGLDWTDAGHLYSRQQHETARLVAETVRGEGAEFDVVWQSRSGPPQVPWLEPDIGDHLRTLAAAGTTAVVVAPTGFVSDHLEVLWDLDEEAREIAAELGLAFARAGTPGVHPEFVTMVRELVEERTAERVAVGGSPLGRTGVDCPVGCCPLPRRPTARPAASASAPPATAPTA